MAEDPIAEAKQALRRAAEAARAEAHEAVGATAGAALAAHGIAALADRAPGIVSAYWPMRGEIDPLPLVEALVAAGWRAALPVTPKRGERLTFREWVPGAPSVAGRYGTSEPGSDAAILEPSVLLIPLLAFDRRLNRLGYGAGFYDRPLGDLRAKASVRAIGVAYAAQEVPLVPTNGWDERLDLVLTERGGLY